MSMSPSPSTGFLPAYTYSPHSTRPTSSEQTAYFLTGGLAGLSTLPIELLLSISSTRSNPTVTKPPLSLTTHLKPLLNPFHLYRPAIRFWAFDLARARLLHESSSLGISSPPVWLVGGLAGGIGGFMEVFVQHIIKERSLQKLPDLRALSEQSAKLFFCFGAYTALANGWKERQEVMEKKQVQLPPKPFWKCWGMGAVAGGFGSAVMWCVKEGMPNGSARWKMLGAATGKGALVVGTVISVQVSSCRWVMDEYVE